MKNVLAFGSGSEISNSFVKLYREKYNIYQVSRCIENGDAGYQIPAYTQVECAEAIERAKESMGHLDVVVVFNGFGKAGKIGDIALEQIDEMVQANLLVPYYVMHHMSGIFREQQDGHLVLVGSVAGIKFSPNFAMYSATKFGLRALSEAFRNEVQEHNVRTTNIQPGFVSTKFWNEFGSDNSKFEYDPEIAVKSDDVSAMIDFCISSESRFTVNEVTCRSMYQER